MIHEEICTYEVCKLAKEKGFNEYEACNHIYEDDEQWHTLTTYTNAKGIDWSKDKFTVAPTQSLLKRWLRDNGFGEVEVRHWSETNKYPHHYGWEVKDNLGVLMSYSSKMFDTYEHALEDALAYSLKNLV